MLVNLPLKNQLSDPNSDGHPDNNAKANCVAEVMASIAEEASGRAVHGGDLKDAVYGAAYTGATNPDNYAQVLHDDYRVDLQRVDGNGSELVQVIISHLQNHTAVAGAIPSKWGSTTAADIAENGGPTHEIGFCDYDAKAGTLTAMNSWPVDGKNAFYHTMPAAWWASRIVYGHVHVANKELHVGVPSGWVDKNQVLLAPNGRSVVTAKRDYILSHPWDGKNLPLGDSYGVGENHTQQVFTYSVLDSQLVNGEWGVVEAPVGQMLLDARAQQKPADPVPADAHDILANVVNVLGPLADAVVRTRSLMKELGY